MKTKKIALILLLNLLSLATFADGYQINSQSARQIGMGHVGTAIKLGSESILFNPAGLSYINGTFDASLGVTAIMSKVKYTNTAGTYKAESDNPVGTPIFGYIGYRISPRFVAGIGLTNPGGNNLEWPDNWAGSHIIQNISLASFSLQPTLSYKISENLSVGAGLMINWGNFELSKGILPVGALNNFINLVPSQYQAIITGASNISPMQITLKGDAKTAYGYNIGLMFSPTNKLCLGISYRSKVMMKVEEGSAKITYASTELNQLIDLLAQASASLSGAKVLDGKKVVAELPIPSNLNIGASYKFSDKLLVSGELQYVGWKAYDTLKIEFPELGAAGKQHIPKNFSNSMIYRIGGEYYFSDSFTLRLGFIYDSTPVDKSYYGPETPATNKISITTGFTYKPAKSLAIDFGFQYLNGLKINGKYPTPLGSFDGEYDTRAFLPSLGFHFSF
ncbi:MAG: outer membrane protein transport protein [Bacteroidales bacterium]|jgi:long-chain fatty acid transport protein|nr:outer membrane protein transport protein [Bacteroidales bacterium]